MHVQPYNFCFEVIHDDYVEAGPAFVILCSCVWAQLAGGATCGNVVIALIGSRVELKPLWFMS